MAGDALALLLKITSNSNQARTDVVALRTTVQKEVAAIKQTGAQDFKAFSKAFDDELKGMDGSAKTFGLRIAQNFGVSVKGAAELTHALKATAQGLLVVGTAALGAGAGIYSLAKQATDLGSEIFDASVKLGFSAETLSALKLSAESSGGSLSSVSAALGIFNVNVSKAHQSGSDLNQLFTRLNISTTDNEKALRKVIEILHQETNATDKARLAKQLLGRGYQDLLGVIDATNGNLDEAIEKFRAMDGLITTDMASRADMLGDQFTEMGHRFRGMATEIGLELAPMMIASLDDFATFLKDNKEGVIDGLSAIGKAIDAFIIKPLQGWILLFGKIEQQNRKVAAIWRGMFAETSVQDAASGALGQATAIDDVKNTATTATIRSATAQKRSSGLGDLLDDVAGKDTKPKKTPGEELLDDLKRQLDSLGTKYDNLTDKTHVQRAAAKLLESQYAGLSTTLRNDILTTARQTDIREKEIANLGLQKKAMDSLRKTLDANSDAVLELLTGGKSHLDIVNELIAANERMNIEVGEETKTLARFNAMLLDTSEGWKRIRDVMKDIASMSIESLLPSMGGADVSKGSDLARQINEMMGGEEPPMMAGVRKGIDMFDVLGEKISGVFGLGAEQAKMFGELTSEAFGMAAQGFASMIQTWTQGGSLGDQAMKKLVSSVLGGVAAMAATQAIYEFAIGIAALTPWGMAIYGPAAVHFKSAALLAGIAATTAVLGRAFAPTQTAQGVGGGASAGGGSAQGRGTVANNQPQPVDVNRSAGEKRIVLEVRSNDSHIVRVVTNDYENRGEVRKVIINDGMRAAA